MAEPDEASLGTKSTVKKRIVLIVILAVAILLAIVGLLTRSMPSVMTVQLSGTTGLGVAGTYIVDGRTNSFSGVLPTNFTVKARNFMYTIKMQDSEGELAGRLYIGGVEAGSSQTSAKNGGVQGWAERAGFLLFRREGVGFTTLNAED